jgi:hypothetical protein
MSQIQAIFTKGFAQIDKAKEIAEEVGEEAEAEIETVQEQQKDQKEEAPTALVQVTA